MKKQLFQRWTSLVFAGFAVGFAGQLANAESTDAAFEQLAVKAKALAAQPYENNDQALPESLLAMTYDGHRDIRCTPEQFLWAGTEAPYRVQFKHRGWLFKEDVDLFKVNAAGDEVEALPFSAERFTYGPMAQQALDPAALPQDMGYAGLSLHRVGALDEEGNETYNELLSIQGGSYFRAVGDGQHWGSSARGIAINTALAEPEEFPKWEELWVRRPEAGDNHVVLYGLMDGPSISGAYRMDVTPGPTLSVDVTAKLFFRQKVDKLGISPITGMFMFGEDDPARFNDFRPEVHDADGLLMWSADGELDWRPLRNPPRLAVSRFEMKNPKGFGLIQRDRSFESYEDLETEMQIRPSIWCEPKGDWGEGWVELLEISSGDEGNDNIGAYWVPKDESFLKAGGEFEMAYRLDFTQDRRPASANVIRWITTRTMVTDSDAEAEGSLVRTAASVGDQPVKRVIIDTGYDSALPNGTIVRADVSVIRGKLIGEPVIQYNKFRNGYRLFFDVEREGDEPVELRATLRDKDKKPVSETWLYRWE